MSSTKEMKIPLEDIFTATNGFSEDNVIGKGGFGIVYKGILERHGIVAIKRFEDERGQGDHEFQTEISLHSKYSHENIASLYGFCDDVGEKILVYRYESNGSLDKHLNNGALTWIQRLRICIDAASGLKYIHDNVEPYHSVFHRGVKSANILLDDDWNAKISNFGMSKFGQANMVSRILITNTSGSFGYIDPEYYYTGHLTQKSDVFSFGVILFEVLCRRPAFVHMKDDSSPILYVMVKKHFKNETLDKIIPSDLLKQINRTSLHTFSTIAYQCLMNGEERPTMKTVVERIKKALDIQLLVLKASQGKLLNLFYGAHHQTQSGTTASSSDSAPTTSRSKKYDVFLSFRGEDTRKNFVDHLNTLLKRQGIITYMELTLARGELISSSLLYAIKESHIALIVFSKNYANSGWCLDELSYIMDCKDIEGQTVIPIFYDVDPSEVRHQRGEYGEAFKRHELVVDSNKVELWRESLVHASNITGWSSNTANGDLRLIQQIVTSISHILLALKGSASTNLIGIQTRIQDLKRFLELKSGGVHMVGICGIGGSGKSALAHTIYDEISYQFEGCCFVEDVCDESRMYGLKTLQEKILSDVLESKMKLEDIKEGIYMMERRLCNKKVLIVLDNVNHIDHLKMLAGSLKWFGDGSRIIITTRNQDLLNAYNVNKIHNVRMLDDDEAIELFNRYAFEPGQSVEGYFKTISLDIISRLGGNPGLLIKYGSLLHGKHMSEWLDILGRISFDEILKMFQDDGVIRLKESDEESASRNLIGIHARIQDLKQFLELKSGDVRIVGICGIWGSGKSALAHTIYDEISYQFEGCCFIKNVSAESRMYGLKALQEKVLSDVLKLKIKLKDIKEGIYMMESKLSNNQVLIVLDNVDHIDHLEMLAGSRNWFGDGSRIIITTRHQDLLNAYNVNKIHNVSMLDDEEAIELFSRCAFRSGQSVEGDFKTVSLNIISRLGGHPTSLIKLSSFLHGKDISDWLITLTNLECMSIDEILKMFQDGDDGVIRDGFSGFQVAKIMDAGVSNLFYD